MATGFSVSVNIGGKVLPSLAGVVSGAKSQVRRLGASLTSIGSAINAPFIAAQKHIAATSKHLERFQRAGRNLTFGVTMPAAFIGANWLKSSVEFEKALNLSEALGDLPSAERSGLEKIAQNLAKRYDAGGALGIANAATELMKAGLTFEQAKGSLEQVLATSAIAGDMTPADVGTSLSKSLAQFQMPVATLDQVTKSARLVTDRMTYAAVNTVASMRDISESFKYAGGVMSATGNSLDQTTGIVMSFAKAGVLGAESGVALRSALVRLVKMPKAGMAALSRIGMNLGDYTSARPVTTDGIVTGLKTYGIDATGAKRQIADIIKRRGGKDQAAFAAEITKAVQGLIGDSSAIGADTISESVNDTIAAAGSKVDVTKFFTDLKAKFDSGAATMGDLAKILEARHISRYMALLKDDLPALIAKVGSEAEGYSQSRYNIAQKGLPADVTGLSAAFDQLHKSLVKAVAPEISSVFERIANTIDRMGKSSPVLLKLGIGLTAAAAAAGPLLFALGAVGRVALAPFRLLSGAVSLLLLPLRSVTAAAVVMRGVLATTLPGAILTGLATAGLFIYNNWKNLPAFFNSFKQSLMRNLTPGAEGNGQWLIDKAKEAYSWFSDLTKSLSADTWKAGATQPGQPLPAS